MDIPIGLTEDGMSKAIAEHAIQYYELHDNGIVCKRCGIKIDAIRVVASECFDRHNNGPCFGGGDTQEFVIPYCQNCEGIPKGFATCIHTLAPVAAA